MVTGLLTQALMQWDVLESRTFLEPFDRAVS